MTQKQTINYHCEKNDHGARWLAGYGDGSSQLNNFEEGDTQYRLTSTPDDRCYGAFTRLDGKRIIIGYDVNYINERIVRVWIAAEYWPTGGSGVHELTDADLFAAEGTVGYIWCYDLTPQIRADAEAANITLPEDCAPQLTGLPAGETAAQFLQLDPGTA